MITGTIGAVFVWLNTLMLVTNATVTMINSVMIYKVVRRDNREK